MARTSICKGCGRLIRWVRTPGGKAMPCDPELVLYWQTPIGREKIVKPNGEVISGELTGKPENAGGWGYISHFATCEKAGDFKR